MDKIDKVLEELHKIKVNQAVTHERVKELKKDLADGEVSFKSIRTELKEIDKRIDFHDRVVGGIVIAVSVLTALFKFKII